MPGSIETENYEGWTSPEEAEFEMTAQAQLKSQVDAGGWDKWCELFYSKSFSFPLPGSEGIDLVVRVRELPTSAASAAGHDLGSSGEGGGGDISFSGVHTWGAAVSIAQLIIRAPALVLDKHVVELGGGTGLPSLVASTLARDVVMTDRREPLLKNFRKSLSINRESLIAATKFLRHHFSPLRASQGEANIVIAEALSWEDCSASLQESTSAGIMSSVGDGPLHAGCAQVILGAELFHEEAGMRHLAAAVRWLLAPPLPSQIHEQGEQEGGGGGHCDTRRWDDEEEGEGGQWLKVLRGADCGVGGFFLAVSPAVSRREGIQVFKAECQRPVLPQHPAPHHRYSG